MNFFFPIVVDILRFHHLVLEFIDLCRHRGLFCCLLRIFDEHLDLSGNNTEIQPEQKYIGLVLLTFLHLTYIDAISSAHSWLKELLCFVVVKFPRVVIINSQFIDFKTIGILCCHRHY